MFDSKEFLAVKNEATKLRLDGKKITKMSFPSKKYLYKVVESQDLKNRDTYPPFHARICSELGITSKSWAVFYGQVRKEMKAFYAPNAPIVKFVPATPATPATPAAPAAPAGAVGAVAPAAPVAFVKLLTHLKAKFTNVKMTIQTDLGKVEVS